MDTLKLQKNRGYVIAGTGGIVAFVAFFMPFISASAAPGGSLSGSTIGGWLFLEFLASLAAVAVAAVLVYRHNAFGLTNMPLEKQIRYGIFTLIGAGSIGLLAELILAVNHSSINGFDLTAPDVSLGVGWWLTLFSAIAIVVGGFMALKNPQTMATGAWQYPGTQSQYPYVDPYSQSYHAQPPQPQTQYPPYPAANQAPYSGGYPPQYPTQYAQNPQADPQQYKPTELGQQYLPTELGQQYRPTELRPNQTGPQQYPNTGPQQNPLPPTEFQPPYSQQPYPPQQMPPA